jgi:antitoxin VapB
MAHAKVFQSGNSQAIRLPKEFRMPLGSVEIFRQGDDIVLRATPISALAILDALAGFPEDMCPEPRIDPPPEFREGF